MAHVAFLFCCLVWGSTFILLERVTHEFAPIEIGIWRLFLGAAGLGCIWWLRCPRCKLRRGDWGKIVFLAVVLNAPPHIIQPYVLGNGFGHSFFGPMVAPIPLITILVSIPMLGIWPTRRQLVGVLGGLACLSLIVDDGFDRGMSAGFLALVFLIPLTSALSNTFIRWQLLHVPAVPLTTAILAVAGLSLMPLEFYPPAVESLNLATPVAAAPSTTSMVFLLLLGVVGSGISTAVFVWLILTEGPLFAGMTTYVVPVLSLLWGVFDRESISGQQLAAIGGVLAMVALVQYGSVRPSIGRLGAAEGEMFPADAADAGSLLADAPALAAAAQILPLPLEGAAAQHAAMPSSVAEPGADPPSYPSLAS